MNIEEKDVLELRLAEREIFRQSLKERNDRIDELEFELKTVRELLSNAVLAPRPALAPSIPQPRRVATVPRRWSVR
jgi:hypothetical protein